MYIDQALKNNIGESLRKDEDVIIASGLRVMKEFGEEILNSKEKLLKIIRGSQYKDFHDWQSISKDIRSDPDFFLELSKIQGCHDTLAWANKEVKNNTKVIESYLKKSSYAIKHIDKNHKNYRKYLLACLKVSGELITSLDKKYLYDENLVKVASETFPEIIKQKINPEFKKNKVIVKNCLKDAENIQYVDEKFKNDKKFVKEYLIKKPKIFKYLGNNIKKDKELFDFFINKKFKSLTENTSDDGLEIKYFDIKLRHNPKIIEFLIKKCGKVHASYPSINSVTKNICDYLNKTEDKEMVSYALENSEYYYDGLNKKLQSNKEFILKMVKHNNHYITKKIPEKFKTDTDILEKGFKNFSKPYKNFKTKKLEYRDINDVEKHNDLYWELYWYIFDKKNPDKLNNQTESVADVTIKTPESLFDDHDVLDYSGEQMNGRAHGSGFASNERNELEHADRYWTIRTYEGEWKNGLPHGRGVLKHFANSYPPDGETDYHYEGEFLDGRQHGDGKEFIGSETKKVKYFKGILK